jgi:hypothetical protein
LVDGFIIEEGGPDLAEVVICLGRALGDANQYEFAEDRLAELLGREGA